MRSCIPTYPQELRIDEVQPKRPTVFRIGQIIPATHAEAQIEVLANFVEQLQPRDVQWLKAHEPKIFADKATKLGADLLQLAGQVRR